MHCRKATALGLSLAFLAAISVAQKQQPDTQLQVAQRAALAMPDRAFDLECERESLAWQAFAQAAGGRWFSQWNRATMTPSAIYGSGLRLSDWRGNTQEEARRQANRLLTEQSELLGLGDSEFREAIAARIGSNWSFVYDQHFRGVPVLDGRADVRVHMTGKISMFGSVALPIPAGFSTIPLVDELSATWSAWQALGQEPPAVRQPGDKRQARLVIFGDVLAATPQTAALCWEIPVSAIDAEGRGPVGRYLIDARTGAMVRYLNDKHECAVPGCSAPHRGFERLEGNGNGGGGGESAKPEADAALPLATANVRGWTRLGTGAISALANVPLAGLEIAVPGVGTVVTDSNGNFSANIASPVSVTVNLDGIRTQLITGSQAPTATFTLSPTTPANVQLLTSAANQEQVAHTSTYYWTHEVNEFLRGILGNSPQLATADQVQPTVNIGSTCNAYYTGNTINFYANGGGCNNTAFSSVVAHEWGHGIDDRYGGISQTNGLSEGWGDICSVYLLDFPIVGQDFFTNGGAIRNAVNNRQYPSGSGVHAQGESWMGFAWDLREILAQSLGRPQAIAITNDIVLGTLPADATNQRDAVREVFLADDNDGDLTNGTPHSNELIAACNNHSLPYPGLPGPANDDCSGAIALVIGLNGPYNTSQATTSSTWPCASGGTDLWFSYTPTASGTLTVDTCGNADYDSAIEILQGSCANLTSLDCNDDSCSLQSSASTPVTAGVTYYVRVGGYNGAGGNFTLNVQGPNPGGGGGGTPASVESYGTGCYDQSRSFYEYFSSASGFDLNGTAMTLVQVGNAYTALPIGAFVPPSLLAQTLTLTDDSAATVNLSGTFNYPGGSTTSLEVCSNGFVSAASGNGTGFTPSVSAWLSSGQPRWGNWHDFNPASGGAVRFEQIGTIAYVTWDAVNDFGSATQNTWQMQFDVSNGSVTYAWQQMSGAGNGHLVGFAAGGQSRDLGSLDISAALPGGFSTGSTDSNGLSQSSGLPRLGTTMNITTTGYPANAALGIVGIGVQGYDPGIDLGAVGAPGCLIHVNSDLTFNAFVSGGQTVVSIPIPNDNAFMGVVLSSQSFALAPGVNQLGITTSNGVRLTFGI